MPTTSSTDPIAALSDKEVKKIIEKPLVKSQVSICYILYIIE